MITRKKKQTPKLVKKTRKLRYKNSSIYCSDKILSDSRIYNLTKEEHQLILKGNQTTRESIINNFNKKSVIIYRTNKTKNFLVYLAPYDDNFNSLKKILKSNKNVIFYIDLNSQFYSNNNKSSISLNFIKCHVKKYFSTCKPNIVSFLGFSMGAYAVLWLSGYFNEYNYRFIAINPITFNNGKSKKINYLWLKNKNDKRKFDLPKTHAQSATIYDLREHLHKHKNTNSYKLIIVGLSECKHSNKYFHGDLLNAGYMLNISNVQIAFLNQHTHQGFKMIDIGQKYNFYNIIFAKKRDSIGKNIYKTKFFKNDKEMLCKEINNNFKCNI
mgnify:CR=1 FL=1|tara:strand:+ start:212 stop:1192 length:981 start_codon:yes stop_codon:yes gene_type:complete